MYFGSILGIWVSKKEDLEGSYTWEENNDPSENTAQEIGMEESHPPYHGEKGQHHAQQVVQKLMTQFFLGNLHSQHCESCSLINF